MNKGKIEDILARLRQELHVADNVDPESRTKAEELQRDVEQLHGEGDADVDSLANRARELETQFAVRHPTLEGVARDLADAIAKMGV